MIETEIAKIAETIGYSINQIYQLNLEYTRIEVMINASIVVTTILMVAVGIIYAYKTSIVQFNDVDDYFKCVIFAFVYILAILIVIGLLNFALEDILVPYLIPDYYAMKITLKQLSGVLS